LPASEPTPPSPEPTASVSPRFGVATATFIVVSSMVGTGILTTSGYTVYAVESNLVMLSLWIVGGLAALCGALALSELAAAMPRSGGDYIYLNEAYGPLSAFLTGWVSFLIGFGGPIALTADASARYLLGPLGLPSPTALLYQRSLATVLILGFALIHCLGRGHSIRAQGVVTIIKLGILIGLAAVGIAGGAGRWENLFDPPEPTMELGIAMIFSLVYISYGYTGWNAAAYVAGEVERPQRVMPRAILLGTGLVMLLYLALNVFYALALTPERIHAIVENAGDKRDVVTPIAQLAAFELFGTGISALLSVALGLTLLSSLSAYILTGPRVAYAMAKDGRFPRAAARLSKRETPVLATSFQVGWSLILLWTSPFESILLYAGVGLAIFSMLSVGAVLVLRVRQPEMPRPFRTPGYPLTPLFYLVTTGLLTAAAFRERPLASALALLSILAGVPIYYVWHRRWEAQAGADVDDEASGTSDAGAAH